MTGIDFLYLAYDTLYIMDTGALSAGLDEIDRAGDVVGDMLTNADKFTAKIENLMKAYYCLGASGENVGKYILESLISKKKGIK